MQPFLIMFTEFPTPADGGCKKSDKPRDGDGSTFSLELDTGMMYAKEMQNPFCHFIIVFTNVVQRFRVLFYSGILYPQFYATVYKGCVPDTFSAYLNFPSFA